MDTYYYNNQIKTYLIQFMALFSGMSTMIGKRDDVEPELLSVPIQYGFVDRVVAHIISENTQNSPLRLPTMSAYLTGVAMAPELRKGIGMIRRQTFLPAGALFPEGIKTIHQLMPIPYRATMELSIYTSNTEQRFQILEQILMLFDPTVQIQSTDAVFDWTKLTTVELENISFDDNYPSGVDDRIMITTLNFNMPIYISAPANLRDDYIKDVFVRIGMVSGAANGNAEMIADLDSQGLDYENWFSLDDVDI